MSPRARGHDATPPDALELRVTVACENAAFEDANSECARILRRIADRLEAGESSGCFQTIHDANGNDVGRWKLGRHGYAGR